MPTLTECRLLVHFLKNSCFHGCHQSTWLVLTWCATLYLACKLHDSVGICVYSGVGLLVSPVRYGPEWCYLCWNLIILYGMVLLFWSQFHWSVHVHCHRQTKYILISINIIISATCLFIRNEKCQHNNSIIAMQLLSTT